LPTEIIEAQIDAVCDDIPIGALKTGMLSSAQIIRSVAGKIKERGLHPLVVDPVMISKSGYKLLRDDAIETLKQELLPLAAVVTPNIHEARLLAGMDIRTVEDARCAAKAIKALGPDAVVVKGGHLEGREAVDVLFDGEEFFLFSKPFVDTPHTHGTGCTYSAAMTANLAKCYPLYEAVKRAKSYVTSAIEHALPIGNGHGPTNHFYLFDDVLDSLDTYVD
jgi:hydroxymethylpyrimidine/phosphomethylpyrimidine kinase